MSARREFSAKVKAAAFERANGICEKCTCKLYVGRFHYDHINPDEMGGEPTLSNAAVLCVACHSQKTRKDRRTIAKSNHVRRKHIGARSSRSVFPGSRASRWKKKISGEVVER